MSYKAYTGDIQINEYLSSAINDNDRNEKQEAFKINNANYKRLQRLKPRIEKIIKDKATFLTLTFTDEILATTSFETRRRYVARFLKSQCENANYVANVDYGKNNHREHYHAVINTQKIDYTERHKIGSIKGLRIVINNSNALSKYVSKLSNHCIKETTKRSVLIYSKN